jgi:hypothetical protein
VRPDYIFSKYRQKYGLKYGLYRNILIHMKTTVEIDDKKLNRVMKLTGLKTMRETIDFALTETERLARISKMFDSPFYVGEADDVVYPDYDVVKMREKEKPGHDSR